MNRLRPIDENFNETYVKRGLQPTHQVIADSRRQAAEVSHRPSPVRDVRVAHGPAPIELASSASNPRDFRITSRPIPILLYCLAIGFAQKCLPYESINSGSAGLADQPSSSACRSIFSPRKWGLTVASWRFASDFNSQHIEKVHKHACVS